MTLAGIAYGNPGRIPSYLAEAAALGGAWSLQWMPSASDAAPPNFAFAARDHDTDVVVIAIRGTYPNPLSPAYWSDTSEDSPFGDMVSWPNVGDAKIGHGTAEGLKRLIALVDDDGVSLEDFVAALPASTAVVVTGHSLGGTLTPVLALALAQADPTRLISATSFAGMTPGNAAFANLFGPGTRLDGRVRRVYNTLDTVSYGWDRVLETRGFYEPSPKGGTIVDAFLLATALRLMTGDYDYTAVGLPVPLQGTVRPDQPSCTLIAYVMENLHQHLPNTYLSLLGAPPLPFSILFGTIVADRQDDTNASEAEKILPITYTPAA
ncbi:lipase [Jiella sp. MQZ9-1]|uniref:Lipase n=1 Tax=Jiella flava TaxID=2816857 RepID=A0A939FZH4_9HYPH|nr:lipase [Jiella flava]MBO0663056.1 lipase [Jiella flava]MCD2471475.1 lipase [Jiella flava]